MIALLGCPVVELPVTYLSIPLTTRRPTAAQLQPLVNGVVGRLPAWKAWLMNKTGCLTLVKSVLSAIPVHQLLAFAPPKKTLKQLEKIQRGFLWAGRAAANGGQCHVNWRHVCPPLSHGGLGVQDMERAGLALRLRWLWFTWTDAERAWQGLDLQFSAEECTFFFASTTMSIGNGMTALFWEDHWLNGRSISETMPMLYSCIPKRRRKIRTVAGALQGNIWAQDIHGAIGMHEIGQYLQLWQAVQHTTLSDEPDQLLWKWLDSGIYSAKSCYLATFHGSTLCNSWKLIWKSWAPPRVKFFHWLANQDRCWTADQLARRGLQHHPRCLLCDQAPETMRHLLLDCLFARQTWHEVLTWLGVPIPAPNHDATLMDWWLRMTQGAAPLQRKALASATLLVPWMIWKHRNECVFDNASPSVATLVGRIKDEASSWAMAGALGLRTVLPSTWDVH